MIYKTMDKLLTVIIPVYNTEETMDRCVESVVSQGYGRMEIILVDDGSPDGSPAKCDRWAGRDGRIRVMHKANGGLSDARNRGLDVATGDYVTFVDSDDFVEKGTYQALMAVLDGHPEYDILEYGVWKFYGSPRRERLAFADREYADTGRYWLDCAAYAHSYMWNKIYRRALFDGIRHPVGLPFEDILTLPLLLDRAKVVATSSLGLYYYCWNERGITANARGKEYRTLLDAHLRVIGKYRGRHGFWRYYLHVLNIQLTECALTGDSPRLEGRRVPLSECCGAAQRLKAAALNCLGMRWLCRVYMAFARVREAAVRLRQKA